MTFAAKGPAPGGRADPLGLSSLEGVDNSNLKPPQTGPQAKSCDTAAEFEIALALAASGWRVAAGLLTLAAQLIEAGDFLSAERNRQRARAQFIEANDAFKQFQEARRAAADVIVAEAFL